MGGEDDLPEIRVAAHVILGPLTVSSHVKSRSQFTLPQLAGAAAFAREMRAIEDEHATSEYGAFYEDLRYRAIAIAILSVASLESYANELFADAAEHLNPQALKFFSLAAADLDRKPVLDKFDWVLQLRDKPKLERGDSLIQDVAVLIALRNALVHFRPEWSDERKRHDELSDKLRPRFSALKWLAGQPHFPDAWCSHSFGAWAIKTCVDFLGLFDRQAQLKLVVDPSSAFFTNALQTS